MRRHGHPEYPRPKGGASKDLVETSNEKRALWALFSFAKFWEHATVHSSIIRWGLVMFKSFWVAFFLLLASAVSAQERGPEKTSPKEVVPKHVELPAEKPAKHEHKHEEHNCSCEDRKHMECSHPPVANRGGRFGGRFFV